MATIKKSLEQAHVTLSNASSDVELLAILTRYGYGIEQLNEGMALYEAAHHAVQTQNDARFSKVSVTQSFQQNWQMAKFHYQSDLRVARVALKDIQATRRFLQLDGVRADAFEAWLGQAKDFYFGLRNQPELLVVTERLGLTAERIEQGIQHLQSLEVFRLQKHSEKGSAVNSRYQRVESFQALDRWMTTFRQLARIVLAPYPGYLSRLALDPQPRKQKKNDLIVPTANSHFEPIVSQPIVQ